MIMPVELLLMPAWQLKTIGVEAEVFLGKAFFIRCLILVDGDTESLDFGKLILQTTKNFS